MAVDQKLEDVLLVLHLKSSDKYSIFLKVANIVFSISSKLPKDSFHLEENYRNFLCAEPPDVTVHGHYSGIPEIPLRDKDKIFSSGIFWDAYRVDRCPVFVLRLSGFNPQPYCIAVFKPEFRNGDVYYRVFPHSEARGTHLPHPLTFPLFHLLMISFLAQGYGVLVHACGIDDGGRGLLFPGSSNNGKTTMARLWQDEAFILNDERIVLRQREGRLWIYGTPWHGEYDKISPRGVPLDKVFFLRHAEANSVQRWEGASAASKLLTHCFQPYWDPAGMDFILNFCTGVVESVPCCELNFVPDKCVVDFIRCVK